MMRVYVCFCCIINVLRIFADAVSMSSVVIFVDTGQACLSQPMINNSDSYHGNVSVMVASDFKVTFHIYELCTQDENFTISLMEGVLNGTNFEITGILAIKREDRASEIYSKILQEVTTNISLPILVNWPTDTRTSKLVSVFHDPSIVSESLRSILHHLKWTYVQVLVQNSTRYQRILDDINANLTSEFDYICTLNLKEIFYSISDDRLETYVRQLQEERKTKGVLVLADHHLLRRVAEALERTKMAVGEFYFIALADVNTWSPDMVWPEGWVFVEETRLMKPSEHVQNSFNDVNFTEYVRTNLQFMASMMVSIINNTESENCSDTTCWRRVFENHVYQAPSLYQWNSTDNELIRIPSVASVFEFLVNSAVTYMPTSLSTPLRDECRNPLIKPVWMVPVDADAYIIVVLPVHMAADTQTGCDPDEIYARFADHTEAVEYAMQILNKMSNGTTFGYILIDSCGHPKRIKYTMDDIITSGMAPLSKIVGTVGFPLDEEYLGTAQFLGDKNLVTISFAASSDKFSEKEKFPYFLRPIGTNSHEAIVISEMILQLRLANVGVVYSGNRFGIEVTRTLIEKLQENDITVSMAVKMEDAYLENEDSLKYVVNDIILKSAESLQALVVFCKPLHLGAVLEIMKTQNSSKLFWVISNTQYDSYDHSFVSYYGEYLRHSVIISRDLPSVVFDDSEGNRTVESDERISFMKNRMLHCFDLSANLSCATHVSEHLLVDTIMALGQSVNILIEKYCLGSGFCFRAYEHLREVPDILWNSELMGSTVETVKFDSKGNGVNSFVIHQISEEEKAHLSEIGKFSGTKLHLNLSGIVIPHFHGNDSCDSCTLPRQIIDLKYHYEEGDVMLGSFVQLFHKNSDDDFCSDHFDTSSFQAFAAVKWALDRINRDRTLLPDVRLGLFAFDACHLHAQEKVIAALKPSIVLAPSPDLPRDIPLVGMLGDPSPPVSVGMERGVRKVNKDVPLFVPSSVDYFNEQDRHPGVFRTTVPVNDIVASVIMLLLKLDWTYVHVMYDKRDVSLVSNIESHARDLNICFATKILVNMENQTATIQDGIDTMLSVEGAVGVVVLLPEPAFRTLLEVSKEKKTAGKLVYVISEEMPHIDEIVRTNDEPALGLITTKLNLTTNSLFAEAFKSLSYEKNHTMTWMEEFWQAHFRCNLRESSEYETDCSSDLTLSAEDIEQPTAVVKSINAIYILATALDKVIKECNRKWDKCVKLPNFYDNLKSALDRITATPPGGEKFSFKNRNATIAMTLLNLQLSPDGKSRFLPVGNYANGKLILALRRLSMYKDGSRTLLSSKCPGKCSICMSADFIEQYNTKVSILTSDGPPRVNNIDDALGVITFLLVAIGTMFALMAAYYIWKFASHKIFNICVDAHVCIIAGTMLQLGSSFIFLFSPTPLVCAIQQAIPGCVYSVCYAGMLIKLNKTACLRDIVGTNQIKLPRWDFTLSYLPVMVAAPVIIYIAWVLEDLPEVEWFATDIHDVTMVEDVVVTWSCKFNTTKYLVFMSFFWIIMLTCLIMSIHYLVTGNKQPEVKQVLSSSVITSISSAVSTCLLELTHNDTFRTVTAALLPVNATAILLLNFLPPIVNLMKEDYQQLKFREMLTRNRAKNIGHLWKKGKTETTKPTGQSTTKKQKKEKTTTGLWKTAVMKQRSNQLITNEVVAPKEGASNTAIDIDEIALERR